MQTIGLVPGPTNVDSASPINLTPDVGQKLYAALNGASGLAIDATTGATSVNQPALRSSLATILPPDQAGLLADTLVAFSQDGMAIVQPSSPGDGKAAAPWAVLKTAVDASPKGATLVASLLGVSKASTAAEVGTILGQKFSNAPASFTAGPTAQRLLQPLLRSTRTWRYPLRPRSCASYKLCYTLNGGHSRTGLSSGSRWGSESASVSR